MSVWVVNTSPLLYLGHLQRLDLLREKQRHICIPQAVWEEIRVKQDTPCSEVEKACAAWMQVRDVADRRAVELVEADLHRGEAETIVLASELSADRLVMDDQDARRFALRRGLPVIGTIGLLLAARKRGEIPSLRKEIDRLLLLGFRVSPRLVNAALKQAGES